MGASKNYSFIASTLRPSPKEKGTRSIFRGSLKNMME
jgi:hypothetical protein